LPLRKAPDTWAYIEIGDVTLDGVERR